MLTSLSAVPGYRRLAENGLQGGGLQYLAEGLPSLVDLALSSNKLSRKRSAVVEENRKNDTVHWCNGDRQILINHRHSIKLVF